MMALSIYTKLEQSWKHGPVFSLHLYKMVEGQNMDVLLLILLIYDMIPAQTK